MDFRIFSLIKSIFFLMLIQATLTSQTANSKVNMVLILTGDIEKARNDFTKALVIDPKA